MGIDTAGAERLIRNWFAAGLAAVDPERAIRRTLVCEGDSLFVSGRAVPLTGSLYVVGFGKAAVAMALGAEAVCGDRIVDGLVITKDGHADGKRPRKIRVAEAAHPIPDDRGIRATRGMLELLDHASAEDTVIALVSGGGSALLEAPRPPVTLKDVARTTDLLLKAGAPIQDLNRVRIPLSLVKGGGLRRAAGRARMVTLILSDVLGNDPRIIASGPTVRGESSCGEALALIDHYQIRDRVPSAVVTALEQERAEELRVEFHDDIVEIVADNATALESMADLAVADGFRVETVWSGVGGEASTLGRAWVDACRYAAPDVEVLLGGGEATVAVRGNGVGGRNTEFTLSAALELEQHSDSGWMIASLATDGQDGPTDVAGAIADATTCERARSVGVSPEGALRENDSLRVFEAAGGIVKPGPTGTNVNDLYVGIRVTTR
jgi:glycerate-2-kinase